MSRSESLQQIVQERETQNQESVDGNGQLDVTRVSIDQFSPPRGNNAKKSWYMTWSQVIVVDGNDKDEVRCMICAYDQILQVYGAYEIPTYRKVTNQCRLNSYVFKCSGTICKFKIEIFCSADVDLDRLEALKIQDGMRGYLFWVSINQKEHDCGKAQQQLELEENEEPEVDLNHPRERLNMSSRPLIVEQDLFKSGKSTNKAEDFSKQIQFHGEIMPDINMLQRYISWKFKPQTVRQLIDHILALFKEWNEFNQTDSHKYRYDKKEIMLYLAPQCYWIAGQYGPSRSIDFESQCQGEVELVLTSPCQQLGLEDKQYSVRIQAYNDKLMERLYDTCLAQFMEATKMIPQELHYEWIACSLPLRAELYQQEAISQTYTIETGPHGETYKKQLGEKYLGEFKDFHDNLSKVSALVLREKRYDKTGKLSSNLLIKQKRLRLEKQVEDDQADIKEEELQLKMIQQSLASKRKYLLELKQEKLETEKCEKYLQITQEVLLNEDNEINLDAMNQMLDGFREDAGEQGSNVLERFNKNCEVLLPPFFCKTAEQLALDDLPVENHDRNLYLRVLSTQHQDEERKLQKQKQKEVRETILRNGKLHSLQQELDISQKTSSSSEQIDSLKKQIQDLQAEGEKQSII